MKVKKFSVNNLKTALVYYKKYGAVIFSDLVPNRLIDNQIKEIKILITNQYKSVFGKENTNKVDVDDCLIGLSQKDDRYRERLYNILQELPSNAKFSSHSMYYKIAKELGIKIPSLRASQVRVDIPDDNRFLIPPHQEIKGIRSNNTLTFISAIKKITKQMGAVQVALGSFKLGPTIPTIKKGSDYQYVDKKYYQKFPLIQVPLNSGETLMFNMYTIHGSCPNTTKKNIRWSHVLRIEDASRMPYLDLDDKYEKYNLKEAKY